MYHIDTFKSCFIEGIRGDEHKVGISQRMYHIDTFKSCFIEGIRGDEHKVGIHSSSKLDCLKLISFELHQLNYTSLPNHIV